MKTKVTKKLTRLQAWRSIRTVFMLTPPNNRLHGLCREIYKLWAGDRITLAVHNQMDKNVERLRRKMNARTIYLWPLTVEGNAARVKFINSLLK